MPSSEAPHAARTLGRRIVAAFTERLLYKAAALFFALVLWLVVSGEEPSEAVVAVRLAPDLDSTLAIDAERPAIRALVIGRKRELLKLYGVQPHLHRTFALGTSDSVRIELRASDVELPAGVDAVVREVEPHVVTLHFARRLVRQSAGDADRRASDGLTGDSADRAAGIARQADVRDPRSAYSDDGAGGTSSESLRVRGRTSAEPARAPLDSAPRVVSPLTSPSTSASTSASRSPVRSPSIAPSIRSRGGPPTGSLAPSTPSNVTVRPLAGTPERASAAATERRSP